MRHPYNLPQASPYCIVVLTLLRFSGDVLPKSLACYGLECRRWRFKRRGFIRSEKLQNESALDFSNFYPEFCTELCSESFPNFRGLFVLCFLRNGDQKSPPYFNAKSPGKCEEKNTKVFWKQTTEGFKQIRGYQKEKSLFLRFHFVRDRKWWKRVKKAENGRKTAISAHLQHRGETPLKLGTG